MIEEKLKAGLEPCRGIPGVIDVRVKGAVGVLQVEELYEVDRLRSNFVSRGVWLRPFSDIIYTTPPLTMTSQQLDKLCEVFYEATSAWARQ
jgi:adenosylmethionine-8-amino-7-oxononanoate aminotransferase